MSEIQVGNAIADAAERGWFVGHFIDKKFGIRHTKDVEIKWAEYPEDEERPEWVTGETRTAICILIAGSVDLIFRNRNVTLSKPGDFVMWGPGVDHKWRAQKGTTTITVRWPSIEQ
jgi:hypothetical protein